MLKEESVTVQQMINTVKAIIEPAYINADAKARFVQNLEACETKEEVDKLCYATVLNGMWYKSKRRVA
jgi:hypothetical protein